MVAEPKLRATETVTAGEDEVDAIKRAGQLLQDAPRAPSVRLTASAGQTVEIPQALLKLLEQAIPLLARGDTVAIVPLHEEMTTQEAADVLNISRPFLIKLLENGTIPHVKVGTHRRVRVRDVLAYKQQRGAVRQDLFKWMLDVAQENNAYD